MRTKNIPNVTRYAMTFSTLTALYSCHLESCRHARTDNNKNLFPERFDSVAAARDLADRDESTKAGEPRKANFKVCGCTKGRKRVSSPPVLDSKQPSNKRDQALADSIWNPTSVQPTIVSTYYPATNTAGAYIVARYQVNARCQAYNMSLGFELDIAANHTEVALMLIRELQLEHAWVHGILPDGNHVFVAVVDED